MLLLTAHDIGFIKLGVVTFHLLRIFTKLVDVVLNVPALVLVKHSKHSLLLNVCCRLEVKGQRLKLQLAPTSPLLLSSEKPHFRHL